jgi:NADPH-dependent glutamate synthase beta subunit-like oxidoreductase
MRRYECYKCEEFCVIYKNDSEPKACPDLNIIPDWKKVYISNPLFHGGHKL